MISVFMYSNYIGRLMSNGLPLPETRPGMFISVGPPVFTGLAFIGIANAAIKVFPQTYVLGTAAVPTGQVLKVVAVFLAIILWSLALFFFCISLLATLCGIRKMNFHLVSERAVGVRVWKLKKDFRRLGGRSFSQIPVLLLPRYVYFGQDGSYPVLESSHKACFGSTVIFSSTTLKTCTAIQSAISKTKKY